MEGRGKQAAVEQGKLPEYSNHVWQVKGEPWPVGVVQCPRLAKWCYNKPQMFPLFTMYMLCLNLKMHPRIWWIGKQLLAAWKLLAGNVSVPPRY